MKDLKEIKTRNELADYIGVPRKKLSYILYVKKIENLYESFDIPKKNGGVRHINAPKKELKQIQKSLAQALYKYEKEINSKNEINSNISHAFEKGKSFITNAEIHRNKRFVINIDLENFFDSFHFGRVRGYFMKNKNYQLPKEVATVIAQLTCYEGRLPQGAPTSPVITNMICNIFDMRLLKMAKKYKLDYTRYADDLSFSTNDKKFLNLLQKFFRQLSEEIIRAGFAINNKKTRVQYKDSHQEVTGIVVNKKLNVDRKYYKNTRAMAYQLYKTGEFWIENEEKGTIEQLEGRFSFINQLDKYNNKIDGDKHKYETIKGREKVYSQFLFYKYFFDNPKPLIITEGKTDIVYLKAALKNMWKAYPELVSKNDKGQFEYKISFLKRSRRIEYFMNIRMDGADTLNNIYKFYTNEGGEKYPNYMKYFKEIGKREPSNAVILFFDNELNNKEKPITKFVKNKLNEEEKRVLNRHNRLHIVDNLYLMITPLAPGEKESDIEMLFDKKTQEIEIDGRTLDKTGKGDKEKYFNKDIFSQYIMKNYKDIDFSGFKPVLDNMKYIFLNFAGKLHKT